MKQIETEGKRLQMAEVTGGEMPRFQESAMMYCHKKVNLLERVLWQSPDNYVPAEQRRETARRFERDSMENDIG
jgi:hypothetical protein